MKKNHINEKGFTLLEVLVAAVIMIVLTAVGVSSYSSVSRKSRDARRSSDLEQIRSALEMYRADYGYYPAVNTAGFNTANNLSGANLLVPTYMPVIPSDPRNYTYQYRATDASGGRYYGYCLAARLESATSSVNNCTSAPTLPTNYNYGLRHP